MKNQLVRHIRKHNRITATFVSFVENGEVHIGFSFVNPCESVSCKKSGRIVARNHGYKFESNEQMLSEYMLILINRKLLDDFNIFLYRTKAFFKDRDLPAWAIQHMERYTDRDLYKEFNRHKIEARYTLGKEDVAEYLTTKIYDKIWKNIENNAGKIAKGKIDPARIFEGVI